MAAPRVARQVGGAGKGNQLVPFGPIYQQIYSSYNYQGPSDFSGVWCSDHVGARDSYLARNGTHGAA